LIPCKDAGLLLPRRPMKYILPLEFGFFDLVEYQLAPRKKSQFSRTPTPAH
jgi:hypothetical protein